MASACEVSTSAHGKHIRPSRRTVGLSLTRLRSSCTRRTFTVLRAPALRSYPKDDSRELAFGTESPIGALSGETNNFVTDVMDIDRTPELLSWIFGSLFTRGSEPAATDSGGAVPDGPAPTTLADGRAAEAPPPPPPQPSPSASQPTVARDSSHSPAPSLVQLQVLSPVASDVPDSQALRVPAAATTALAGPPGATTPESFAAGAAVALAAAPFVSASANVAVPAAAAAGAPPSSAAGALAVATAGGDHRPDGASGSSSSSSGTCDSGQADGAPAARSEVAVVGGGCFWCIEACFRQLQGVIAVTSGYAGGHVESPTYQQVLTKTTGHAEVVRVEYDPTVLSYKDILQVFMTLHDPTTPNRSGNDVGPQYRSIILTSDDSQRQGAEQVVAEFNRGLWFGRKACTEVAPLKAFYPAESYHQRYYSRNPTAGYCVFVVTPKLQELRRKYGKMLRQDVVR